METARTSLAAAIAHWPMPDRMKGRPLDRRGFPVPFFVTWFDAAGARCADGLGRPDFRVVDPAKVVRCRRYGLCWLCGEPLGRFRAFVVGPMCLVTRTSSEPESHCDCAEYAVRACPWMANPAARRNDRKPYEASVTSNPMGHPRNPGVAVLFVHTERGLPLIRQEPPHHPLFQMPLGDPHRLTFWREARLATRLEVIEALDSGMVVLHEAAARLDGPEGLVELERRYRRTLDLVARWTSWPVPAPASAAAAS